MKDEWVACDAITLGELIRKGEIRPTELLEIVIDRIERVNPKLNAVIHKLYDQARKTAAEWDARVRAGAGKDALFAGVPFLLKDLIAETKGAPFHEGCRAVTGYVSKLDTELVTRQKKGGLIIAAKTNTPEFGLVPTTEPALYGPTLNPWNTALTPGGSSGGSAAAVAAGVVPMAHGNDAGGSIRIPASCCGLFGLKPTRARNPLGPIFGDGITGLVHEHAVTRTVRDSAGLLDITSGPTPGDPYWAPPKARPFLEETGRDPGRLRIGLLKAVPEGWHNVYRIHPDCEKAARDAASLCESLGHIVEEIPPEKLRWPGIAAKFSTMISCYVGHAIVYWERELGRKINQEEVEPLTWASSQAGLKTSGVKYLAIVEEIQRFSRMVARLYDDGPYDLLLTPTLAIPPPPLGSFQSTPDDPTKLMRVINDFVVFTRVQNMTGQPAMSVPLYWNDENIPIGVQFAGRFGDEATLFRLAFQLEKARPWADRKPRVHCGQETP